MGAIQAYDHTFPMVALGNPSPFMASLWRNLYKSESFPSPLSPPSSFLSTPLSCL